MNEEAQEPAKKPARKSTRKAAKEPGKEPGKESANKRKVWLRGLYMLFMLVALHLIGTLLAVITVIQFVVVLLNGVPNDQLVSFGRNLGNYLRQIALYLTYSTEETPFPFSDWPSDE